jgi:ABC-type histidine transport system ATPase subunit
MSVAPDPAAQPVPALLAEDVHKSFGSLEVLKGVSLTAHEGDVIAMLGASGSGKMTAGSMSAAS